MTIGEIIPENKTRGRPKAKEKMEQITIKLPPTMIDALREMAGKSYNPMSMHILKQLQNI